MTVRQRLAPQHPFPAALLDVFHGYMSLLAPPPGSPHDAVPASSIVLAGDSSGACLALGLLQVLLSLRRQNRASDVKWYGQKVDLALPAGLTLISAVGELTNTLPSFKLNAPWDLFPDPTPLYEPGFPACENWPSNPPRGNVYCDLPMLCHPICSPMASKDWTGSPPLWFASGQEQLVDAVKVIAQTAFGQGVTVVFQEYEAMPHIFMWRFPEAPQVRRCWTDWAEMCKALVSGAPVASQGLLIKAKGLQAMELDLSNLSPLSVEDARSLMEKGIQKLTVFKGHKPGGAML